MVGGQTLRHLVDGMTIVNFRTALKTDDWRFMSAFEISLFITLTSVAGMFIGSTLAYFDVSGLPENQTKMPLCTKECPT
jgi:ABC-type glycerol-3-phosphate transport system permease component